LEQYAYKSIFSFFFWELPSINSPKPSSWQSKETQTWKVAYEKKKKKGLGNQVRKG
jgi:hypothetical protein